MTKLEKCIKGLEVHLKDENLQSCEECPYNASEEEKKVLDWDCHWDELKRDALELLKEREPRVLTWEEIIDVTNPVWYEERDGLSSWALCTDVSRGNAYEDMSYEFFENYDNSYIREYADKCNVYWRCWSARPTDEQREAVKWDD